jgi:hypothetical protein
MSMSQFSVVSNAPRAGSKAGGRLTFIRNVILLLLLIALGTTLLAMMQLSASPDTPITMQAILGSD